MDSSSLSNKLLWSLLLYGSVFRTQMFGNGGVLVVMTVTSVTSDKVVVVIDLCIGGSI